MATLQCQFCGAAVTIGEPIGRDAQCESCGHDLRCCRNCRHYDPRYNNACTEPMADPVVEKERRNFCEYFYFSREAHRAPALTAERAAEARQKLEQMFGSKPGADRAADARKKLEDLFRKPPPGDAPKS